MDITTALDRHLDQSDDDFIPAEIAETPYTERIYLMREIAHIEKILANDGGSDNLVSSIEWEARLRECRSRLRRLLEEEQATLKSTSELHCQGLIKVHLRQLELESQLAGLEVSQ